MAFTREEIGNLIESISNIEKISTISSDGGTLLTRIPKEIIEVLKLKKGQKIRWIVKKKTKELIIKIENE